MRRAKLIVPILSIVALVLFGLAVAPGDLFGLRNDIQPAAAIDDSAEPAQDQAGITQDPVGATCSLPYAILEPDGVSVGGCFTVLDGLTSYSEVIERLIVNNEGQELVTLIPGRLHYEPIVLTRPFPSGNALSDWREQVVRGEMESARRNGIITLLDSVGTVVGKWNFSRGWPCRYEGPSFKASAPVLVETIEICHEGFSVRD